MTDDDPTSIGARIALGIAAVVFLALGGGSLWLWISFGVGAGPLGFGVVALLIAAVALYAAVTDPEWLDVGSRVEPTDGEMLERRTDEPGFEDE